MNADFLGARLVLWWVNVVRGGFEPAIADIKREMEKPGLKTVKKLMLAYVNAAAGNKEEAGGCRGGSRPSSTGESRLAYGGNGVRRAGRGRIARSSGCSSRSRSASPACSSSRSPPGRSRCGPIRGTGRCSSGWDSADRPDAWGDRGSR